MSQSSSEDADPEPFTPVWGDDTGSDVTLVLKQNEIHVFEDADSGLAHTVSIAPCSKCKYRLPAHTSKFMSGTTTVMHLHAQPLSKASSFFATRISTDMAGLCSECRVAALELDGHEFEAAHHVLRFIYTSKLPSNNGCVPDGMLLVWMLKAADRLGVPSCMDAIFELLTKMSASRFPINSVFSLPSTFCSQAVMDRLLTLATRPLLQVYGTEPHVLFQAAEFHCLLILPYKALLTLLESKHLYVDSEGTVAYFLQSWLLHNACSNEQQNALVQQVRYGFMTPGYVTTCLPLMPDVGVTQAQMQELLSMIPQRGNCSNEEWLAMRSVCPERWFIPRQQTESSGMRATIELRLRVNNNKMRSTVAKVAVMSKGGKSKAPPPAPIWSQGTLARGLKWYVQMSCPSLAEAFSLRVHVCLPSQEASPTVEVECRIQVSVFLASGCIILQEYSDHRFRGSVGFDPFSCGRWAKRGDAQMEHWKHLLQDGHLCICVKIKAK